jgi:hypothetical protein
MSDLDLKIAKLKVSVSHKINKTILGPLAGNLPFSSIRSIEEILYDARIQRHVEDYKCISEPVVVQYSFPDHFPIYFRRSKTFEKRGIYTLREVNVSPHSGLVWIKEGYIFEESAGSYRKIIGWGSAIPETLLKQESPVIEFPLISCPPLPFYHWLLELFPNLLLALEYQPDARILIRKNSPSYVVQALEIILGKENFSERVITSEKVMRVKKLIMPQFETYSGFIHPIAISALKRFYNFYFPKATQNNLRLYISRKRTAQRRLSNEEALEIALKELGFIIVYCEELNFREQILLFSQAGIVVAPHGAGLSNIIWAKSSVNLLEIFPDLFFNDCYARLAVMLDHTYNYLNCKLDSTNQQVIPIDLVINKVNELIR